MARLARTRRPWPVLLTLSLSVGCASKPTNDRKPEIATPAPDPPRPEIGESLSSPSPPVTVICPGPNADPPSALAAPASPSPDVACRSFPRKLTRRLHKAAREKWTLSTPGSKLEVTFGCDAFGDDLGELIFERSGGHSFSLGLYRIRPRDDDSYEITALRYRPSDTAGPYDPDDPPTRWEYAARGGAEVQTAIIPAERIEPVLLELRAAMQMQLREIEPPPSDSGTFTREGTITSLRSHTAYRFVDSTGLGKQDFWAGSEGSLGHERWVPLGIAEQAFSRFVFADDVDPLFTERVPTDADRDFFAERFATARGRGIDYGYWYVRERLLGMARTLGDARLTRGLLELLALPSGSSEDRSRAIAVEILGGLVDHDARYDADGSDRSVEDAAAELRSRCGPSG